MENYDRTMELVETAQNSAGKSDEQFAKYTDTLEYKVNSLRTAWESLRQSFLKSDFLKKAVDLATNLANKLSDLKAVDFTALATIGLTIGKSGAKGIIDSYRNAFVNVSKEWKTKTGKTATNTNTFEGKVDQAGTGFKSTIQQAATLWYDSVKASISGKTPAELPNTPSIPDGSSDGKTSGKNSGSRFGNAAKAGLANSIAPAVTTLFTSILTGQDLKTTLASTAASVFASIIPEVIATFAPEIIGALTGPVGIAVGAIAVVGVALYKMRENEIKQIKETEKAELERLQNVKDRNNELATEQSEAVKDTKSNVSSAKKLQEDIDTYNKYYGNAFLTDENQEKLDNAIDDLNENYPSVVSSYDENTKAITINTDAVEALKNQYEKEREENTNKIIGSGLANANNWSLAQDTTDRVVANLSALGQAMQGQGPSTFIDQAYGNGKSNLTELYEGYAGFWKNDIDSYVKQVVTEGESLVEEQQTQILSKMKEIFNDDSIDSFQDLYDIVGTDVEQIQKMSDAISELNFENFDKQMQDAYKDTISSLFQNLQTEDFQITAETANIIAEGFDTFKFGKIDFDIEKNFKENEDNLNGWNYAEQIFKDKGLEEIYGFSLDSLENPDKMGYQRQDWSELPEEIQKALDYVGAGEKWYKKINSGDNTAFAVIADALAAYADQWKELQDTNEKIKELSENEQYQNLTKEYEDLQSKADQLTLDEYTKTLNNIIERMKKVEGTEETIKGYEKFEKENENSPTKQNEKLNRALQSIFPDNKDYENWSKGAKESLVNTLQSMNLTPPEQEKVAQTIQTSLSKFTGEQQSKVAEVLSQIDFTQGFSALLANKSAFVDKLKEVGLSANDAANLYSEYIQNGTNAIIHSLSNIDALKTAFDQYAESIQANITSNKDLTEAMEKWASDSMDTDSMIALMQGAFDSISFDKNGELQLDTKDIPKKMAQDALKNLENQISQIAQMPAYAAAFDKKGAAMYNPLLTKFKDSGLTSADYINKNQDMIERLGLDPAVLKDFLDSGAKDADEYRDHLQDVIDNSEKYVTAEAALTKQSLQDMFGDAKEAQEDYDKAVDNLAKAKRNLNKAIRDEKKSHTDLAKALRDEKKAQEDLDAAYNGSKFYDSNLDDLYNYEQQLESLNKLLEKNAELIENSTVVGESAQAWNDYASAIHDTIATTEARNQLNQKLADEGTKFLQENYSQYFTIDDFGKLAPDISFLEDAKMPDAEKDFIGEQIQKVNEYVDAVADGEKEIYDTRKEYQDKLKDLYKNYVSLEDNVADVLKKQAEEEVSTQKDKYSQLKEADDDYLDALQDAIDKQRKLRDMENDYEDLAQKQKKLSLMQRDTSGANRKEALSLEEEIKDDQQNLLDDAVDNIIDNMKSLQETQQELRDTEIELKEAIIDDTNWSKQANEILKTFTTSEDYIGWMAANDPDFQDMSVDKQAVQMADWEDQSKILVSYLASQTQEIQNATQTTANEVLNIITTTSEGATGAIERDSAKVQKEISDAQLDAQQALLDAQDAVANAKDGIEDAKQAVRDAQREVSDAKDEVTKAKDALDLANLSLEDLDPKFSNLVDSAKDLLSNLTDENLNNFAKLGTLIKDFFGTTVITGEEQRKANQTQVETRQVADTGKTKYANDSKKNANLLSDVKTAPYIPNSPVTGGKTYSLVINTNGSKYLLSNPQDIDKIKEKDKSANIYVEYLTSDIFGNVSEKAIPISSTRGFEEFVNTGWVNPAMLKKKYATGGLVDYTGPAWVDGTKTKPEAFLSATDTENIRQMMDIMNILLSNFSTPSKSTYESSSNVVSPNIEVTVNVDSISSDYDVDQATERVKQNILDAYNKTGNSVILRK